MTETTVETATRVDTGVTATTVDTGVTATTVDTGVTETTVTSTPTVKRSLYHYLFQMAPRHSG